MTSGFSCLEGYVMPQSAVFSFAISSPGLPALRIFDKFLHSDISEALHQSVGKISQAVTLCDFVCQCRQSPSKQVFRSFPRIACVCTFWVRLGESTRLSDYELEWSHEEAKVGFPISWFFPSFVLAVPNGEEQCRLEMMRDITWDGIQWLRCCKLGLQIKFSTKTTKLKEDNKLYTQKKAIFVLLLFIAYPSCTLFLYDFIQAMLRWHQSCIHSPVNSRHQYKILLYEHSEMHFHVLLPTLRLEKPRELNTILNTCDVVRKPTCESYATT